VNDQNSESPHNQTGAGHHSDALSTADAFTEALLDAASRRTSHAAGLTEEEQDLLATISDWLPGLPDALVDFEAVTEAEAGTRQPVRPDDPIAQMLGLVEDPAVRLDGRRLASVRKAAGLNIADLAQHLQQRGWDVTIAIVSAWERNRTSPPPATINAIAEELAVTSDALLAAGPSNAQTLDVLFDDQLIAAFLDEWSREVNIPAEKLAAQSKRLLATAGKRNATSATPQTLLAILRHFRNLPGFEAPE
jgi:transcriptional regulator with XRE-family HTH domain